MPVERSVTDFSRTRYPSSPTALLAIAAGLFAAPALYLAVGGLMRGQVLPTTPHLSSAVRTALWIIGATQLVFPLTISRSLPSLPAPARFVVTLGVTTSAPIFGLIAAITGGSLMPLALLGAASMLATIAWSWRYRECFKSRPLEREVAAYTVTLVVSAIAGLLAAVLRALTLEAFQSTPMALFATAMNVLVALGALVTARLRRLASPYAQPATRIVSFAHLYALPFGFVVFFYWLFWVRRREHVS